MQICAAAEPYRSALQVIGATLSSLIRSINYGRPRRLEPSQDSVGNTRARLLPGMLRLTQARSVASIIYA